MTAPPTTVEFLGLPGSGKSTLSHCIAQRLLARGIAVSQRSYELAHDLGPGRRRLAKTWRVLREAALHPAAAVTALRFVASTRQRDLGTRLRLLFNWLLVVDLARTARQRPGVHFFDQGLLQAVWSIALEDDGDGAVELLRWCALQGLLPGIAVVVAVRLDIVERRLAERSSRHSRIERNGARADLLRRGEQLVRRVRDAALRTGSVQILELANEAGDPEQVAAAIADRLPLASPDALAAFRPIA